MDIDQERDEGLKAENARLRARVEELERLLEGGRPQGREPEPRRADGFPYQALFDALPIALIAYRSDGLAVAINAVNCKRFGTTAAQIVGKYNILQDPQAVAKGYAAGFQRALTGEVVRMPPRAYDSAAGSLKQGQGRRFWTEATYVPLRAAAGAEVRFVVAVSLDVTAHKEAEALQRWSVAMLEAIIDNAPLLIYARDVDGRHTIMNRKFEAFIGKRRDELLGKTAHELMPEEIAEALRAQDAEAMDSAAPISAEERAQTEGPPRVYLSTRFALRDEEGGVTGVCGISLDITERVRAEETSRRLQEEIFRVQEETLRALSTPLLPIADGVVVMPLIGEVSRERAGQLLETLLRGISSQRARIAILDVTGMPRAGPEVTEALTRVARSVRLLGAKIILTGIQPSLAQALVGLGADLEGIVTQGTLERGVAYALSASRNPSVARFGASW